MAGVRSYFSYSVIQAVERTDGDSNLVALKGVDWAVRTINSSGTESGSLATVYVSIGEGAAAVSNFSTGSNGLIEFWADPGVYAITITDPKNRIAQKKIYWDSVSGQSGGIPGALLEGGSVTTNQIGDTQVKTADIDALAVTTAKIADSAITAAKIGTGEVTFAKLGSDVSGIVAPVGSIMDFAGANDPSSEWLLCDGRQLSQAGFPALFTVVGSSYNTGGETAGNFRIPDLRGRVSVGAESMGTQGSPSPARLPNNGTRGNSGGSSSYSLTTSNIPKIDFTPGGSVTGGGDHSHSFSGSGSTTFNPIYNAAGQGHAINLAGGTNFTLHRQNLGINVSGTVDGAGTHSHGFSGTPMSIGNVTPTALDMRQPYLVVNKIIRVK